MGQTTINKTFANETVLAADGDQFIGCIFVNAILDCQYGDGVLIQDCVFCDSEETGKAIRRKMCYAQN